MFARYSVKRYLKKLRPTLAKQYGQHKNYSASQIRTIVYKKGFNPKYLPLAYIMCLKKNDIPAVLSDEFPDLCMIDFEQTIKNLVNSPEISQHLMTFSINN